MRGQRLRLTVATAALAALLQASGAADTPQVRLPDLTGRPINPFDVPASTKALVVLFVSAECPVSNRYAPEMIRLHDRYAPQGIAFRIVYPNPAETPEIIQRHLKDFSLPPRALRDPAHAFVKAAGISITPEAAVYDGAKRLVYRGRIDDRYVNIGVERPAPTRRDLEEVVAALAAGTPVEPRTTQAVGCYVADFVPVK
jgi:AhpC/TSA family